MADFALVRSAQGDLRVIVVGGYPCKRTNFEGWMSFVLVTGPIVPERTGSHKVVDECTLPLTSRRVVRHIITDLAVGDVPGSPRSGFPGALHEMNAGLRLDGPS